MQNSRSKKKIAGDRKNGREKVSIIVNLSHRSRAFLAQDSTAGERRERSVPRQ